MHLYGLQEFPFFTCYWWVNFENTCMWKETHWFGGAQTIDFLMCGTDVMPQFLLFQDLWWNRNMHLSQFWGGHVLQISRYFQEASCKCHLLELYLWRWLIQLEHTPRSFLKWLSSCAHKCYCFPCMLAHCGLMQNILCDCPLGNAGVQSSFLKWWLELFSIISKATREHYCRYELRHELSCLRRKEVFN